MDANRPSRTALSAAVARGTHRLWDEPPWIFDDPFALPLVGEGWEEFAAGSRALVSEPIWRQGHAGVLVRSRYPEDRLVLGRFDQYVILSAGFDSFAWRRPDLLNRLYLFEVDHPATQARKRERVEALSLPRSERHIFVPVDFETQVLPDTLDVAGFDWSRPTLFSWVGSTMYVDKDAIASTLGLVASCTPGSEIGEPVLTSFAPTEMEDLIKRSGLHVAEHPTADELAERYCSGRTDGLRPYTLERLISVVRLEDRAD